MWKPLLEEIMKLYVNPVVIVTTYTEHTRSRNMKATFRGYQSKVGMVTTYTEHTRSRNMEPTFIGNHESIGSERLPFLLTTSGLPKMITTN